MYKEENNLVILKAKGSSRGTSVAVVFLIS